MVIWFSVCLYSFIQIISAEILKQDVASLDVLNNLQYIPLADLIRSKRQFNNPPVGSAKDANLPNGFDNGMPIGNNPGKGLPKNMMYNNGLFNNFAVNGKSLPYNLPFLNVNNNPQNRLLPNINGVNNYAFTVNNLPVANNIIENLSNLPNPNVLPNNNQIPNILPNGNNVLDILPSFENNCDVLPPPINNLLPQNNKVLPSYNLPNSNPLPLNNLPNNNLLPLNNLPNYNLLPPNNLPYNNALPPNNLPNSNLLPLNNLPFNNLPPSNILPSGNVLPINNLPNGNVLPPNSLPNSNFLPQNNLPFNILPPSNTLPSGNVLPINDFPNGNILPISNLPVTNVSPSNNLPNNNVLPLNNLPINTLLPNIKNFRITGFQFADGVTNFNGIPQNGLPMSNLNNHFNPLPASNILPDIAQRVSEEISNINNQQINNAGRTANPPFDNGGSNILPIGNAPPAIANELQNTNFVKVNGVPDTRNVLGNHMPVSDQQFIPFNNAFAVAKPLPTVPINALPPNLLNNVILVGPLEAYLQNLINSGVLNNNHQCHQMPVNNLQYNLDSNMPGNQNFLPNDCQADFVTNNLNLAQEIVKKLKIEGLPNLPFLNGLPVAGITETVTVLNSPCK